MKKIFILMCVAAACFSTIAQTYEKPWNIGIYGGRAEYNGEYGNKFFDVPAKFYGLGALTFSRYLNRSFDVALYGSFGNYGAVDSHDVEFRSNMVYGDLTLKFKILRNDNYVFRPYIFVGAGARYLYEGEKSNNLNTDEPVSVVIPAGIGIDLRLSEAWSLRYIGSYGYGLSDKQDNRKCGDYGDQQLLHNIGVTYSFACSPRDSDKDGVIDDLDKCPETPAGITVDQNGCPLDEDVDGVPDYLDKCLRTPTVAQVDAVGCPIDTDKDGVADYIDECPETPDGVKVDGKGCPLDSDGDGVADYLDKCPNSPSEAKGKVDEEGCPTDKDGDGVYDFEDRCPDVPGIRENKGCPEIKEEYKKVLQKALNGIEFESGKSTIKRSSHAILDQIATMMIENPAYLLDIKGHTDNVGNAAKNQILSEERANAVKTYLEGKGVEAARMTAAGFGDTTPIADNKTAAGRAKNRRVEFVVNF
jgi:outer membrane protein OmpA-like peptidoglycan-associated protein